MSAGISPWDSLFQNIRFFNLLIVSITSTIFVHFNFSEQYNAAAFIYLSNAVGGMITPQTKVIIFLFRYIF